MNMVTERLKKIKVVATKILVVLVVLYLIWLLILQLSIYLGYSRHVPSDFGDARYYSFNPKTILTSLESGGTELFVPISEEAFYENPLPSEAIQWSYEDYSKVVGAFHKFIWEESLDTWDVDNLIFMNANCDDPYKFDKGLFGFHKHEGNPYFRSHVGIYVAEGSMLITTYEQKYTGRWKGIDLNHVKVDQPDQVIDISEANGGRDFRLKMSEDCNAMVLLAPYAFDHDFPPPPFNRIDWGWHVIYYGEDWSKFDVEVDPFSGSYRFHD